MIRPTIYATTCPTVHLYDITNNLSHVMPYDLFHDLSYDSSYDLFHDLFYNPFMRYDL